MRDRAIVVAFFGLIVAGILFTSGTGFGAGLGLIVLFIVLIFVALQPRGESNSGNEADLIS